LVAVEDEVFAQEGRRHGVADRAQVRQAALEERLIREHADGRGAVPFVGAGDGHRVEVRTQYPRRRRGFLDLGDDLHAGAALRVGTEVAHGPGLGETPVQFTLRRARPTLLDLAALACDDLVQDGHGAPLTRWCSSQALYRPVFSTLTGSGRVGRGMP